MNSVNLVGRLTRDPDLRYTSGNQTAVARFSVAIDRGKDKRTGEDMGADFPSIIVFGKTAENCSNYLTKGDRVGITGRIQTGSYVNRDGQKVYTTDVVANRVEFLESKRQQQAPSQPTYAPQPTEPEYYGFHEYDENEDEIPF